MCVSIYRYKHSQSDKKRTCILARMCHGQNPTLGNADQTIPGDFYIHEKNSHHGMYDHHPYTQTYICIVTDHHLERILENLDFCLMLFGGSK